MLKCPIVIATFCFLACAAVADVKMPGQFGDHMVLQQGQALPVWGWADVGEKITVHFVDQQRCTTADANGKWRVELAKIPANSQPQQLVITGNNKVIIDDVLVGEVWFCSGQSNMASVLENARNAPQEIANANHPLIRFFRTAMQSRIRPQDDVNIGSWEICSPATAGKFSSVAYFFARKLQQELNVPVAMVVSAVGATAAESWINEEGIATDKDLIDLQKQHAQKAVDFPPALDTHDWKNPEFSDEKWKTMSVPGPWEKSGQGMDQFDGCVWFRKEIMIPQNWAGRELTLYFAPIDDGDTTYFNGQRVGSMNVDTPMVWVKPRQYTVPATAVKAGRAVIAVRITDQLGDGGFVGTPEQMSIGPSDAPTELQSLAGAWKYAVEERWPPQGIATTLYAGMVAPWIDFPIAGFVWYQGESNAGNAAKYQRLLRGLITGWRTAWKQNDAPFLVVQLPNYKPELPLPGDSQWAALREAQAVVVSQLPRAALAVTIDIGEAENIHPKNKQDVGLRLGLLALTKVYQKNLIDSGPVCDGVKIEGSTLRLHFANIGKGLVVRGELLKGFAIAGADRKFVWANAIIDGDSVIVQSEQVASPTMLRYAWADNPGVTLFNSEGFPAAPFRVEGNSVIPRVATSH